MHDGYENEILEDKQWNQQEAYFIHHNESESKSNGYW